MLNVVPSNDVDHASSASVVSAPLTRSVLITEHGRPVQAPYVTRCADVRPMIWPCPWLSIVASDPDATVKRRVRHSYAPHECTNRVVPSVLQPSCVPNVSPKWASSGSGGTTSCAVPPLSE